MLWHTGPARGFFYPYPEIRSHRESNSGPDPSESEVDVVGGAGLQLRQGVGPKYNPYKMSDKVIDWKDLWFYVENQAPAFPRRSAGPPIKRASWNSRGGNVDQVNYLLGEIDLLKKNHQISGASVVAHWSLWRI